MKTLDKNLYLGGRINKNLTVRELFIYLHKEKSTFRYLEIKKAINDKLFKEEKEKYYGNKKH